MMEEVETGALPMEVWFALPNRSTSRSAEALSCAAHFGAAEETMPCSCVEGCACANAAMCSGSGCIGSEIAGANIVAIDSMVNGYHRMWYSNARVPGEPSPEEQEEIRGMMRDRNEAMLQRLQEKLRKVESESPGGLVRTEHHLDREKVKLTEHIRRLEHEISILSSE